MQKLDLTGLVKDLISLIDAVIPVLAGIAVAIFFWGLVNYIREAEDTHAHNRGKELITWGLIALFVLFALWGVLDFFQIAFFSQTYNDSPINAGTLNG